VPVYSGRILKPKTLLSILEAAGISPDQLRGLL
jgi:predicted RNA binding protein YcfA (HicA-like mRNA interferase family)